MDKDKNMCNNSNMYIDPFSDRYIDKQINKEIQEDKKKKTPKSLTDEELLDIFVNDRKFHPKYVENDCLIDSTEASIHGAKVKRYRRTCLRCEKIFIGRGKFNRSCSNCK